MKVKKSYKKTLNLNFKKVAEFSVLLRKIHKNTTFFLMKYIFLKTCFTLKRQEKQSH